MVIPPISWEFVYACIAVGCGTAVGVYMAGRHNKRAEQQGAEGLMMESDAQMDMLDAAEALANRNAVLDAVGDNNAGWLKLAAEAMRNVPDGTEATGEGFRQMLLDRGLKPPAHPNAWGALTNTLAKRKVLVPTGEYRPMLSAASHGRKTAVYVKSTPEAA